MHRLMHGADHGVSVIVEPRRIESIDQLHALRMIACCRGPTGMETPRRCMCLAGLMFFSSRVVLRRFRAFGGGARPPPPHSKSYLCALEIDCECCPLPPIQCYPAQADACCSQVGPLSLPAVQVDAICGRCNRSTTACRCQSTLFEPTLECW